MITLCKAKKYAEQLLNIYEQIENDLQTLYTEKSKLEGLELDILHIMENEKFNASQGFKLAKMIQDARKDRRELKIEIETLANLKKSFVDKNINILKSTYGNIKKKDEILNSLKENKVYNPRVLETTDLKLVTSYYKEVAHV